MPSSTAASMSLWITGGRSTRPGACSGVSEGRLVKVLEGELPAEHPSPAHYASERGGREVESMAKHPKSKGELASVKRPLRHEV